ncbi:hypothetical protein EVAR_70207_1 [Eumeta japonica]|uniref:DNA helicase Pif1-like 2B domain-containing protein n=1 Tax=Eumeta variegata TaxID=151549 RepID=A0A4C1ZQ09_EUMVA|nr:hypothetical protein EVAR_70207_1 [Eumeta japonica]
MCSGGATPLVDVGDIRREAVDGRRRRRRLAPPLPSTNRFLKIGNGVYPELDSMGKPLEWLRERAILTPKNDQAPLINDLLLESFQGKEIVYYSIDTVVNTEEAVHYPVEFLNTINPSGLSYPKLSLRVDTPVMLFRNIKPPKLFNGTRRQVKVLHRNLVEATILTGPHQGEIVFVPLIPLIPNDLPFEFKRFQFP